MKRADAGALLRRLAKNKYVFLVLALGLTLLLLPGRSVKHPTETAAAPAAGAGDPLDASGIPLDTEALRLAALLEQIEGVGAAGVLLSREGAVVVCAGAEDARVRYAVTNAVAAYTGLGSDRIRVEKMK